MGSRAEKLKKLRRMSAAEADYRLREKLRAHWERVRSLVGMDTFSDRDFLSLFSPDSGSADASLAADSFSFKTYLQNRAARRFYLPASQEGREKVFALIARDFPEWIERAVDDADRICRHTADLLAYQGLELGRDIQWHRDPITGRDWPRRFWSDYDLVASHEAGDPKVIHELNRHQHLPRLGKAYFLTAEERYAHEAVAQMESWIDQNPQGLGVNWSSSLEIAVRSLSWMWTLFFLLSSRSLTEAAARRIGKSLFAQIDHVARYPSIFSSPNTHLIGEACALFVAGIVFREVEPATLWLRQGSELLAGEAKRQVTGDGVHTELSTCYHCYALDFFLQAAVLAERNQYTMPSFFCGRLGSMTEFVMHMSRPDGTIPFLGDDDGGRALALRSTHYRNFQDALSTGAVLFQRPDFKLQSGAFREETLWLLGESAWNSYAMLPGEPPATTGGAFSEAGYFVQRSGWGKSDSHLVFDCGGLGQPSGGHGHADCLSVVLFAEGKDLLIDPGTGVYNGAPEWRNFFRSTGAHNTALVDGQDQSLAGGTFGWRHAATGSALKHVSFTGLDYVEGAHTGFGRLEAPIVHRRMLLNVASEYWVLVDDFCGKGRHSFDLLYHFAPHLTLSLSRNDAAGCLTVEAAEDHTKLRLFLLTCQPASAEVLCGRTEPRQGWVAPRYGGWEAAPVLHAGFSAPGPATAVTFLVPALAGAAGRRSPGGLKEFAARALPVSPDAFGCELRDDCTQDVIVFSRGDSECTVADFSLRGEVFWLRSRGGALERIFAVNARSLKHRGETLFESREMISSLSLRLDENAVAVEPQEIGERINVRNLRDRQLRYV